MARFNIAYTITAIDKFSETAERLKTQLSGVRAALTKTADRAIVETSIIDRSLKKMGSQLQEPMVARAINFQNARNSIEKFNHWASAFAFRGFINSMNVVMPLMLLFHKPFKDLIEQQKALAVLSTSNLNVAALKTQAQQLSKVSTFSVADIMSSQAILAAKSANQKNIQQIMKVAINVAARNNESLKQAVQQINNAIFARGKVSTVGSLVITGGNEHQRILSLINQAKSISGVAAAQAVTTTGKLKQALNNVSESLTKFLIAATPAFNALATALVKVSKVINNFVTHHKHLVKIIAYATIAVLGLVAAQVVLGAVFVGAGLALGIVTKGYKLLSYVLLGATFKNKMLIKVIRELPTVLGFVEYGLKKVIVDWGVYGVKTAYAAVKTVAVKSAMLAWRAASLALRGAMLLVNGAIAAFNILLDANPIGAVIIGISALIAGIYELTEHWKTVKKVFFEVCNAVYGFIDHYMLQPIKELYSYIKTYITPVISTLKNVGSAVSSITGGVVSVVAHPISSIEHGAASVAHGASHLFSKMLGFSNAPASMHSTTHVHLYNSNSANTPTHTYTTHSNQSLHANVGTTHLEHHHIMKQSGVTYDFVSG
jgi:hypothetical protein